MTDLIARLEQATEGSRELDVDIHCEVFPDRRSHKDLPKGYTLRASGSSRVDRNLARSEYITSYRGPSPHYTTSLDAAMPGENIVNMCKFENGTFAAYHGTGNAGEVFRGDAKTEALARRIAALKARKHG